MAKLEIGDYAKVIKLSDRAMHGVEIGDMVKIEASRIGSMGTKIYQISPVYSAGWNVAFCREDNLERIEFSEEDKETTVYCECEHSNWKKFATRLEKELLYKELKIEYLEEKIEELEWDIEELEEDSKNTIALLEFRDKIINNLQKSNDRKKETIMKYEEAIANIKEKCKQL